MPVRAPVAQAAPAVLGALVVLVVPAVSPAAANCTIGL